MKRVDQKKRSIFDINLIFLSSRNDFLYNSKDMPGDSPSMTLL